MQCLTRCRHCYFSGDPLQGLCQLCEVVAAAPTPSLLLDVAGKALKRLQPAIRMKPYGKATYTCHCYEDSVTLEEVTAWNESAEKLSGFKQDSRCLVQPRQHAGPHTCMLCLASLAG